MAARNRCSKMVLNVHQSGYSLCERAKKGQVGIHLNKCKEKNHLHYPSRNTYFETLVMGHGEHILGSHTFVTEDKSSMYCVSQYIWRGVSQ